METYRKNSPIGQTTPYADSLLPRPFECFVGESFEGKGNKTHNKPIRNPIKPPNKPKSRSAMPNAPTIPAKKGAGIGCHTLLQMLAAMAERATQLAILGMVTKVPRIGACTLNRQSQASPAAAKMIPSQRNVSKMRYLLNIGFVKRHIALQRAKAGAG